MADLVEDWLLDIMDSTRVELGTQLHVSRAGDPCFLGLYPGDQVAADHCSCGGSGAKATGGCGMAWVRLARLYPATKFPTPDIAPTNLGITGPSAVILEAGVMRCLPVTGASGGASMPSEAQQMEATLVQISDEAAIRRALVCAAELQRRDTVLGSYTPMGLGGCGGGAWQVTARLRPARGAVAP